MALLNAGSVGQCRELARSLTGSVTFRRPFSWSWYIATAVKNLYTCRVVRPAGRFTPCEQVNCQNIEWGREGQLSYTHFVLDPIGNIKLSFISTSSSCAGTHDLQEPY